MATITVDRVIAADPTSAALLLAAFTGVPPRRRPASYVSRFGLAGGVASLRLSYAGWSTAAVLTVTSRDGGRALRAAVAFLSDLADAAEARADAA